MTLEAGILQRYPLPVSRDRLQESITEIDQQLAIYQNIVHRFEKRHDCILPIYERRIAQNEVSEHPAWEESLEWGVALDELERLHTIRRALRWILNFSN